MDTKKFTKEYRLSQWARIIKARNESGKSIKEFCEDTGISKHAYFYWQRRLRQEACKDLAITDKTTDIVPNGWVKLSPPAKQQYNDDGIMVEINGCHITVRGNTDLELLKSVCSVLRQL
mgnify:CR=1 FL=1